MVSSSLALKLFEAFSIERWNDLIRPFELTEMDKAAERAMLAYIMGKYEEKEGAIIQWDRIMYGTLFDVFRKIALCDIKAPVQRKIRTEYPQEFKLLTQWVLDQFKPYIDDSSLMSEFSAYVTEPQKDDITARILAASHKYSTLREFEIIKRFNDYSQLIDVEKEINNDIAGYMDLKGLQLLLTKQQPYHFLLFIEQLRYQSRWNQTPRVPKTTVLGHSYFVAALTLLMGRELKLCPRRQFNNFFSALFHDLPEAVTRDIISPVKQATRGLPEVVKKIEADIVNRDLMPTIDPYIRNEIVYFTTHEFENRITDESGLVTPVPFDDLCDKYNHNEWNPVDGRLVRAADHISAFMEADASIRHGITSKHLTEGRINLERNYPDGQLVNGMDICAFMQKFRYPVQGSLF